MYNTFISTTQTLYEKAFPFRTKTVSIAVNHRPWITSAIKKSINKKNLLYKSYVKHKTTESFNSYKAYRNKLTAILRKAEKNYYAAKLENVKDNLAKTWKILNSIISRTTRVDTVIEIVSNDQHINDPCVIANQFNSFFANVGPNLAKNIPSVASNFKHFLPPSNLNSFFLSPTDEAEV